MINLPSVYKPGDWVSVHTGETPYHGIVEAVRFTDRSVTYEVISNGLLIRDINSCDVKDPIGGSPDDK